jgi:hypothetical protein
MNKPHLFEFEMGESRKWKKEFYLGVEIYLSDFHSH